MTATTQLSSDQIYNTLEKLRTLLKLRVEDMIQVLGVSRPTYYGWKKGRRMNKTSSEKALMGITILLKIAKDPEWQKHNDIHLTIWKRREILQSLLSGNIETDS